MKTNKLLLLILILLSLILSSCSYGDGELTSSETAEAPPITEPVVTDGSAFDAVTTEAITTEAVTADAVITDAVTTEAATAEAVTVETPKIELSQILPEFTAGTAAENEYLCGQGIDAQKFGIEYESRMKLYSETTEGDFASYLALLDAMGYESVYDSKRDGNIYRQIALPEGGFAYLYFTGKTGETRIIYDNHSDLSPKELSAGYEKKDGEGAVFYQFGLQMLDAIGDDDGKINYGMLYAARLADGSLFIIDGGSNKQFMTKAEMDRLYSFLREISGTEEGETIKVSGWYVSHGHHDHIYGFMLCYQKYSKYFDIDNVFFNFPSVNSEDETYKSQAGIYRTFVNVLRAYSKDGMPNFIKLHTGQSFTVSDMTLDVLYTHEDLVDPKSGKPTPYEDYNNSCAVVKLSFGPMSILMLGDINTYAARVLINHNGRDALKTTVLQPAHHMLNDLSGLYNALKAKVLLIPQSRYVSERVSARKRMLAEMEKNAEKGMVFFASERTVGIAYKNGRVACVYSSPVPQ